MSATAPPDGPGLIAVYGTLRRGFEQNGLLIASGALYLRDGVVEGLLYDLGPFPGLRPGEGRISAELYKLPAFYDFTATDRFEGFDTTRPEASLFVRRTVELLEPAGRMAWAYFLNAPPPPSAIPQIEGWWGRSPEA